MEVSGENTSTCNYHVNLLNIYISTWVRIEFTTLVIIGTDSKGRFISSYGLPYKIENVPQNMYENTKAVHA